MSQVPELINQLYRAKTEADRLWEERVRLRQAAAEAESKWGGAMRLVDQIEQKIRDTETASLPINKNL